MTIYEVFRNGRMKPLDVVENYRSAVKKWGRKAANANALYLLRVHAGLETPPPPVKEALADLRASDPAQHLSKVAVA